MIPAPPSDPDKMSDAEYAVWSHHPRWTVHKLADGDTHMILDENGKCVCVCEETEVKTWLAGYLAGLVRGIRQGKEES